MKKVFKYIIVDSGPIFFGEKTVHSTVAQGFEKIYSAGYVIIKWGCINVNEVKCYGKAVSLDLLPNIPVDQRIIKDYFDVAGMFQYNLIEIKDLYK